MTAFNQQAITRIGDAELDRTLVRVAYHPHGDRGRASRGNVDVRRRQLQRKLLKLSCRAQAVGEIRTSSVVEVFDGHEYFAHVFRHPEKKLRIESLLRRSKGEFGLNDEAAAIDRG